MHGLYCCPHTIYPWQDNHYWLYAWGERLNVLLPPYERAYKRPILPTGTVDFAHRHRPYIRDGLRYRDRKREVAEA